MENVGTNSDLSPDAIREEYKEEIDELRQHMAPKERFRTYTLSEEFVEKQFEKYKERHSDEDERTQRENYQKTLDGIFQNKSKRAGAKVFCICCGAGKRSPLRKWKTNRRTGDAIYICSDCWKIKEQIGEEQFEKALRGISE